MNLTNVVTLMYYLSIKSKNPIELLRQPELSSNSIILIGMTVRSVLDPNYHSNSPFKDIKMRFLLHFYMIDPSHVFRVVKIQFMFLQLQAMRKFRQSLDLEYSINIKFVSTDIR